MSGTLYVVATPLGNAADWSPRAQQILAAVAAVYCEDTRTTGRLLAHQGVTVARTRSLHAHNEDARVAEVLGMLRSGDDVALVSDAGTPAISDPGGRLVAAAHADGFAVRVVPGPSAVTALLSVAGLPSSGHRFIGFLPKGRGARDKALAAALEPGAAVVFFVPMRDAPAAIAAAAALQPDAIAVLGRELTKVHEEVIRAPVGELAAALAERRRLLGEATVAVWVPADAVTAQDPARAERLAAGAGALLEAGLSRRDTARVLSDLSGLPRREATALVLRVSEGA